MKKAEPLQRRGRDALFFLTALLVIAADQLSKLWIRTNLATGESLPQRGLFRLTHIHNSGAIFGLFPSQSHLLTVVSLVGIIVIPLFVLFFSRRVPYLDNRLSRLALGLLLGGTAGNLIDRLSFGYVTDFIDIGIWPIFNIADSAVVIGVILFAYSLLCSSQVSTDLSD